jgi:hypothetical protein
MARARRGGGAGHVLGGRGSSYVSREAYSALHIRISKALDTSFDVSEAENVANSDWAEDITAFSGDSAA